MERRTYSPGERLVSQGALAPEFQVIEEGVASVSAAGSRGQRLEFSRVGPGDCIGEMALLTGEPASADIIALTPMVTRAIAPDRLKALPLLHVRPRLIDGLSVILAARLKRANERMLAAQDATVHMIRLPASAAVALHRLAREMAKASGDRVQVVIASDSLARNADALAGGNVAVQTSPPEEMGRLRARLDLLVRECRHVLLFLDEDAQEELLDTRYPLLSVVDEGRLRDAPPSRPSERFIVISDWPWTHASVRKLSTAHRRDVIALLPRTAPAGGPRDPVAKLARELSGSRVGLALGAGAAKGFAHIGVLRALDELRVPIDIITGSSIGAAIAAGYAAGYSIDDLAEAAKRIAGRAVRPTLPLYSFLSNRGIRQELERLGAGRRFDDLELPLAIVATDIYRRCEVTFTSGLVWPAILASMAIPGIYPPVRARGSYLVDGGVLSAVPAKHARELGANVVLGVRLSGQATSPKDSLGDVPSQPFAPDTITRCMEIMLNRLSEVSRDHADVTIEVCLDGGGLRDFRRGSEYARAGYRLTMAAKDDIRSAVPAVPNQP